MTRMTRLLERNEQFTRTYTSASLGLPTAQVVIVACLDHRVDPAIVLGLQLGEAPVIRNAGGRVTQAVIDDIAFFAFLIDQLSGAQGAADTLFEVAVIHHTQCGTGFLANPSFRQLTAAATGLPEAALEASARSPASRPGSRRLTFAPSRHLAGGRRAHELLIVGAALPAVGQVLPGAGEPVTDRHQFLVRGAARRAGREMQCHRGAILVVKRAEDERREVIAPPGAALGHLLLSLSAAVARCLPGRTVAGALVTPVSSRRPGSCNRCYLRGRLAGRPRGRHH